MEPQTTENTEVASRKADVLAPRIEWEYVPSRESTDIVEIADRYDLFIGGEFRKPKSGKYFPTVDPATEETLAEVAEAGPDDVDAAVAAARAAFEDGWGRMPGSERAKVAPVRGVRVLPLQVYDETTWMGLAFGLVFNVQPSRPFSKLLFSK